MTSSAFSKLRQLVPPPNHGASPDWAEVAEHLSFTPPEDYRRIVEAYGAGLFAGEVAVWVPGGRGGEDLFDNTAPAYRELLDSRDWVADGGWQWIESDGRRQPVDLGPDPLAFGAWGGGSSGAYGYWHQVGGDPDDWPVLYTDLASLWLYHRGGVAAFIVDLLTGRFDTELVDPAVPDSRVFEPLTKS
ncbi:hypothetical protein AAFP30_04170 [Gordonia sp. CPCC 205515]|uniref:hypothetical protein n=1 Tax=Gordonia sp. CPCC 205515 TaxID=3140791 RepID=UPI003AF3C2F6